MKIVDSFLSRVKSEFGVSPSEQLRAKAKDAFNYIADIAGISNDNSTLGKVNALAIDYAARVAQAKLGLKDGNNADADITAAESTFKAEAAKLGVNLDDQGSASDLRQFVSWVGDAIAQERADSDIGDTAPDDVALAAARDSDMTVGRETEAAGTQGSSDAELQRPPDPEVIIKVIENEVMPEFSNEANKVVEPALEATAQALTMIYDDVNDIDIMLNNLNSPDNTELKQGDNISANEMADQLKAFCELATGIRSQDINHKTEQIQTAFEALHPIIRLRLKQEAPYIESVAKNGELASSIASLDTNLAAGLTEVLSMAKGLSERGDAKMTQDERKMVAEFKYLASELCKGYAKAAKAEPPRGVSVQEYKAKLAAGFQADVQKLIAGYSEHIKQEDLGDINNELVKRSKNADDQDGYLAKIQRYAKSLFSRSGLLLLLGTAHLLPALVDALGFGRAPLVGKYIKKMAQGTANLSKIGKDFLHIAQLDTQNQISQAMADRRDTRRSEEPVEDNREAVPQRQ